MFWPISLFLRMQWMLTLPSLIRIPPNVDGQWLIHTRSLVIPKQRLLNRVAAVTITRGRIQEIISVLFLQGWPQDASSQRQTALQLRQLPEGHGTAGSGH
jgi:hypothetical protein